MPRKSRLTLSTFLATVCCAAVAGPPSDAHSTAGEPQRAIPVLVRVDSTGKISDITPASNLSPRLDGLLRANLEEIAATSAGNGFGSGGSRQFIANMALDAIPTADGKQSVKFLLVSSQPVPPGRWAWTRVDNRKLVLVNQDQLNNQVPQTISAPRVELHREIPSPPPVQGKSQT